MNQESKKQWNEKSRGTRDAEFAGRATTPVDAASSACTGLPALHYSCSVAADSPAYLYAIAALDGPARWMTSKRLKPISRHHFSKSDAE